MNKIEKNAKSQKGITIIALVVTIIVLIIISGIGINYGMTTIKKVELEGLKTNMLLIKAKAREYVEEANFKIGKETDTDKINLIKQEIYETNNKLQKVSEEELSSIPDAIPATECYIVTQETLEKWGLDKIKVSSNEKYLIKFDETNLSVEIYNTNGYEGEYSLTDIEN